MCVLVCFVDELLIHTVAIYIGKHGNHTVSVTVVTSSLIDVLAFDIGTDVVAQCSDNVSKILLEFGAKCLDIGNVL